MYASVSGVCSAEDCIHKKGCGTERGRVSSSGRCDCSQPLQRGSGGGRAVPGAGGHWSQTR